jgi:hypothetical protein
MSTSRSFDGGEFGAWCWERVIPSFMRATERCAPLRLTAIAGEQNLDSPPATWLTLPAVEVSLRSIYGPVRLLEARAVNI